MDNLESYIKLDNDIRQRPIVFQGTHDEWEALTSTQKAHYQYIAFTDDTGSPEVVDSVPTQNSTHLVQSGGVWSGLHTVNNNFGSVELSSVSYYAHAVGECFINAAGQLVRCVAAIAPGDSIIIGTNVIRWNIYTDILDMSSHFGCTQIRPAEKNAIIQSGLLSNMRAGTFFVGGYNDFLTFTDAPTPNYWAGIVYCIQSYRSIQIAIEYDGYDIEYRYKKPSDGTWSAWKQFQFV